MIDSQAKTVGVSGRPSMPRMSFTWARELFEVPQPGLLTPGYRLLAAQAQRGDLPGADVEGDLAGGDGERLAGAFEEVHLAGAADVGRQNDAVSTAAVGRVPCTGVRGGACSA